MRENELKNNYYMFGGKGDVWSNTAHIAKSGKTRTLCEKPMLSTNWCRIEEVEHIGCPTCLEKYKEEYTDVSEAVNEMYNNII